MHLTIPGRPIAKKRPQFARRGKFVTTYNDQETEEGKFIQQLMFQLPAGFKLIVGPVQLILVFHITRPKSHYGTGRNSGILKPSSPFYPSKKPDIDNCLKFVMDCMNGIVYLDDSQVVKTQAKKLYSGEPQTEIYVYDLG